MCAAERGQDRLHRRVPGGRVPHALALPQQVARRGDAQGMPPRARTPDWQTGSQAAAADAAARLGRQPLADRGGMQLGLFRLVPGHVGRHPRQAPHAAALHAPAHGGGHLWRDGPGGRAQARALGHGRRWAARDGVLRRAPLAPAADGADALHSGGAAPQRGLAARGRGLHDALL
eukprot:scaffold77234_cov66-Phaeocystis_antarctica.AAC.2